MDMFHTRKRIRGRTSRSAGAGFWRLLLGFWLGIFSARGADSHYGFLFDEHKLTLASGVRQEFLGPIFSYQQSESSELHAFSPLFSISRDKDKDLDILEYDFLYPLLTYDRFGAEYRWQFFQLLSLAGGKTMAETDKHRFTLFPFFFQQRATDPTNRYTALFPLYGTLKNRLFRDEVQFILFPGYLKTRKRDVVTENYLYPFFHTRQGDHLSGWQVWPFFGREHKDAFTATNAFGDAEIVGGHDKLFVLWPFFLDQSTGRGTDNPSHQQALVPLYSLERSPQRDSTSFLWPLGLTLTDDRARKYREVGAPWPVIVFARGEGKTTTRIWPFYSHAHNAYLQSDFLLWPLYKYNRFHGDPLERERARILFFLYSGITERNTETKEFRKRTDLWPLFTHKRDYDGAERLQVLTLLEPFIPNNKSIERNYSPIWSLWRAEKNPKTGAASQSLLWNLYRHESAPGTKRTSFLFGIFQYKSHPEGRELRLFFIPISKQKPAARK